MGKQNVPPADYCVDKGARGPLTTNNSNNQATGQQLSNTPTAQTIADCRGEFGAQSGVLAKCVGRIGTKQTQGEVTRVEPVMSCWCWGSACAVLGSGLWVKLFKYFRSFKNASQDSVPVSE